MLLFGQPIEMFDDPIGLAAHAVMITDGTQKVGGASVVEKENALPGAPERSGAKLVLARGSLRDAVRKAFAHVVDGNVRIVHSILFRKTRRFSRETLSHFLETKCGPTSFLPSDALRLGV